MAEQGIRLLESNGELYHDMGFSEADSNDIA